MVSFRYNVRLFSNLINNINCNYNFYFISTFYIIYVLDKLITTELKEIANIRSAENETLKGKDEQTTQGLFNNKFTILGILK